MAIDRTSKFAFACRVDSAGKMEAAEFLRDLVEAVPYAIHTVLGSSACAAAPDDNGLQCTNRARDLYDSQHIFDRVCDEHGIEHRLTKVNHPWTNGQVERMSRTLKDATAKRYHDAGPTTRCAPTSSFSLIPTTTPAVPRRCAASPPMSSPVEPGPKSQNGSGSTRHTTPRD